MIDIEELNKFHATATESWHNSFIEIESETPWCFVHENHRQNFLLWHEEDLARRNDVPAEDIKKAKRAIDQFNQLRNNAMEKIDDWVLSRLEQRHDFDRLGLPLHSETPGMIIDRLSIMSLKSYHMQVEAERTDADNLHREKCQDRVNILAEQINDLSASLRQLLIDVKTGAKQFKLYRQFKMYNDIDLNPQLYKQAKLSS